MTETPNHNPPAGWYPDPDGGQRYWDGTGWTEHVAPAAETATPAAAPAEVVPAAQAAVVPSSGAVGLQMKQRNIWAVWIGLPIITLGIYHFVWYYKIHREMADYDRRRTTPVAGPMLVILLLGWTVIAPIISYHNTGKRIRERQVVAGITPTCSPALSWILWFVFGLNSLYMQTELNKVIDVHSAAAEGTTVPLAV